jgi:methionyl-tRNA formyltransferase
MKIVFFGTANVALPILELLSRHHEILGVVTSPDSKVGRAQILKESAVAVLASELKVKIFKPRTIKNNEAFKQELAGLGADIFVVVAYGKILPLDIINLPPLKTVNVHFSLLPKYRGPSPIQTALLEGINETGTSIFILDEKVDTGPMLAQEKCPIDFDDNYFSLSEKLAHLSARLILPTLEKYSAGELTPTPQDDTLATYTKIFEKSDGRTDWQKSATEIYNQFRAFFPWPGIWCLWQNKKIKILECSPGQNNAEVSSPGQVLPNGTVACGQNTFLKINRLQMEGKTDMAIKDFTNGNQNFIGSQLN